LNDIYPAYNNGDAPFGTFEGLWVYWLVQVPSKHISDFERAFDYIVFVLDQYPQTGYMGCKTYDSTWKDIPMWANMAYLADSLNGEAPIFSDNGFILSKHPYRVDASVHFPGAGEIEGFGGPVYADWPQEDGGSCVIGVISGPGNNDRTVISGGPAPPFLINWAREHYP
jgi:hypothetical protein